MRVKFKQFDTLEEAQACMGKIKAHVQFKPNKHTMHYGDIEQINDKYYVPVICEGRYSCSDMFSPEELLHPGSILPEETVTDTIE